MPKSITCNVMSMDTLKALATTLIPEDKADQSRLMAQRCEMIDEIEAQSLCTPSNENSMILAGLHACGDLSVMMLKAFVESVEVKAVVSIGCCYNLLSEDRFGNSGAHLGFPMSCGVKGVSLSLGKCYRDLACQIDGEICQKTPVSIILSCMLFVLLSRWCSLIITQKS